MKRVIVFGLSALTLLSACIVGPKQDDPASLGAGSDASADSASDGSVVVSFDSGASDTAVSDAYDPSVADSTGPAVPLAECGMDDAAADGETSTDAPGSTDASAETADGDLDGATPGCGSSDAGDAD